MAKINSYISLAYLIDLVVSFLSILRIFRLIIAYVFARTLTSMNMSLDNAKKGRLIKPLGAKCID